MDGTLLPMDQELFTRAYFKKLTVKLAPYGYEPKKLVDAIWAGTAAMVKNDGSCTNEEAFWRVFASVFGERVHGDLPLFESFYREEFNEAQSCCGFRPEAGATVAMLRARGIGLVLASNPIFPAVAQRNRLRWAGVDAENFAYITSYENSRYCKPNAKYYTELAEKLSLAPEECLMVGNDAREDCAAEQIGMKVFLLTDCLINTEGRDISIYPHGGYGELKEYLGELLR